MTEKTNNISTFYTSVIYSHRFVPIKNVKTVKKCWAVLQQSPSHDVYHAAFTRIYKNINHTFFCTIPGYMHEGLSRPLATHTDMLRSDFYCLSVVCPLSTFAKVALLPPLQIQLSHINAAFRGRRILCEPAGSYWPFYSHSEYNYAVITVTYW